MRPQGERQDGANHSPWGRATYHLATAFKVNSRRRGIYHACFSGSAGEAMKDDPIRLTDSTPYFERHFMLIEDTPNAYVSAFREAQFEALAKRRQGTMVFWAVVALSFLAWLGGIIPFVLALLLMVGIWALVSWRNRHESRLLARTFELALEGKDRAFQEYMWRHLDRRMLSEGL